MNPFFGVWRAACKARSWFFGTGYFRWQKHRHYAGFYRCRLILTKMIWRQNLAGLGAPAGWRTGLLRNPILATVAPCSGGNSASQGIGAASQRSENRLRILKLFLAAVAGVLPQPSRPARIAGRERAEAARTKAERMAAQGAWSREQAKNRAGRTTLASDKRRNNRCFRA